MGYTCDRCGSSCSSASLTGNSCVVIGYYCARCDSYYVVQVSFTGGAVRISGPQVRALCQSKGYKSVQLLCNV